MSAQIHVTVEFLDGTKETFQAFKLKRVRAFLDDINKTRASPIFGLQKNGQVLPSRQLLADAQVNDGDTLQEADETKVHYLNHPDSAFKNTQLRKKLQKGNLSKEDVIEVLIVPIVFDARPVIALKTATLDEFKQIAAQVFLRPMNEFGKKFDQNPEKILYGWKNLHNLDRSYNGSMTLESLGIQDGDIIQEYELGPKPTRSSILKRKVMQGTVPATDIYAVRFETFDARGFRTSQSPIFVRKTTTIDDFKDIIAEEALLGRRESIQELMASEPRQSGGYLTFYIGWSMTADGTPVYTGNQTVEAAGLKNGMALRSVNKPTPRPRPQASSSSRPATAKPSNPCDSILATHGITDRKTLMDFAKKYHPDKTEFVPGTKEYEAATEFFKKVYGCGEKFLEKKGGKRKTRHRKRRNNSRKQ